MDLESINLIYNQAVDEGFQTADLQRISLVERLEWFQIHTERAYPIFVFEFEEKVIGWLSLSPYRKGREALRTTAEISYYIHKDYQNNGFGKQLMRFAIQQAPHYQFQNLIAILLSVNTPSIALLQLFGFQEWGRMPNIAKIQSQSIDHLYLGLPLSFFSKQK